MLLVLLLQKGDRETKAFPPRGPHLSDHNHVRGQLLRSAPSHQSQAAAAASAAAAAAAADVEAACARDEAAQGQRELESGEEQRGKRRQLITSRDNTSPRLSAAAAHHLPSDIEKPLQSDPRAKETLARRADQLQQQQQHLKQHKQQLFCTPTPSLAAGTPGVRLHQMLLQRGDRAAGAETAARTTSP
ncbi:hypothetical protein Emag_003297 [Eimeria magna]